MEGWTPMAPEIRSHSTRLADAEVTLRPMSAADWPLLIAWNSDPAVVAWADAEKDAYTEEEIDAIYSNVSRTALCFIIEQRTDGTPIGECWIQQMNLPRYAHLAACLRLSRIDIMIGLPSRWGCGYGRRSIGLLADHALHVLGVDAVFGCDILRNNVRGLAAFRSQGFRERPDLARPGAPNDGIDLVRWRVEPDEDPGAI